MTPQLFSFPPPPPESDDDDDDDDDGDNVNEDDDDEQQNDDNVAATDIVAEPSKSTSIAPTEAKIDLDDEDDDADDDNQEHDKDVPRPDPTENVNEHAGQTNNSDEENTTEPTQLDPETETVTKNSDNETLEPVAEDTATTSLPPPPAIRREAHLAVEPETSDVDVNVDVEDNVNVDVDGDNQRNENTDRIDDVEELTAPNDSIQDVAQLPKEFVQEEEPASTDTTSVPQEDVTEMAVLDATVAATIAEDEQTVVDNNEEHVAAITSDVHSASPSESSRVLKTNLRIDRSTVHQPQLLCRRLVYHQRYPQTVQKQTTMPMTMTVMLSWTAPRSQSRQKMVCSTLVR